MKSNCVYLVAVGLMASGMVFAQSSQGAMDSQSGCSTESQTKSGHTDANGDLPASKEAETQSGKPSQANPESAVPGSIGTAQTPDQGLTPEGERPATGMHTDQKGSSDANGSRPGVEPTTAPPANKKD